MSAQFHLRILALTLVELCLIDGKPLLRAPVLKMSDIRDQNISFRINGTDKSQKPGTPLSSADFNNYDSLHVSKKLRHDSEDPTTTGGLFEGDIILDESKNSRNAITDLGRRWKDGFIPYEISDEFSRTERSIIARGIGQFHVNTCIRFLPHTDEKDYVFIKKSISGCGTTVGRIGGDQDVALSSKCVLNGPGTVIHELMHVLGFWHEQSRSDRDDHVSINWDNIQSGRESNFKKYSWGDIDHLQAAYDVNSILHYGPFSFAVDRSVPTIQSLQPRSTDKMGQRQALSSTDIYKINRLYECI